MLCQLSYASEWVPGGLVLALIEPVIAWVRGDGELF